MRVRRASRWPRWSAAAVPIGLVIAWLASGVSLGGLTSARTRDRTGQLLQDMWPPALPSGGWSALTDGVLDTLAMAILAMAVAGAAFAAARVWPPALWCVVVALAVNWFGDSLDGTLARVRRVARR